MMAKRVSHMKCEALSYLLVTVGLMVGAKWLMVSAKWLSILFDYTQTCDIQNAIFCLYVNRLIIQPDEIHIMPI